MEETISYVDYPLGENVVIIFYKSLSTHGKMIMLYTLYKKKQNKLKRLLKDCNVYKMIEGKLTEQLIGEYENEC